MTKENIDISKEVLHQYDNLLGDWLPKDTAVAIAIGDRYIHYIAGLRNNQLKEGQIVKSGSIADKVIQQRCKVETVLEDSLFDVPCYCMGYPIDLCGEPGALVVILPPSHQEPPQEPLRFLTGKQEDEWSPISIEEIAYIESLQKKTWFYSGSEQYNASHTLKVLQSRLPNTFLRVHRSYIVNIPYIQRITRDFSSNLILTLKDGTELPVSQTYMNEVKIALGF